MHSSEDGGKARSEEQIHPARPPSAHAPAAATLSLSSAAAAADPPSLRASASTRAWTAWAIWSDVSALTASPCFMYTLLHGGGEGGGGGSGARSSLERASTPPDLSTARLWRAKRSVTVSSDATGAAAPFVASGSSPPIASAISDLASSKRCRRTSSSVSSDRSAARSAGETASARAPPGEDVLSACERSECSACPQPPRLASRSAAHLCIVCDGALEVVHLDERAADLLDEGHVRGPEGERLLVGADGLLGHLGTRGRAGWRKGSGPVFPSILERTWMRRYASPSSTKARSDFCRFARSM